MRRTLIANDAGGDLHRLGLFGGANIIDGGFGRFDGGGLVLVRRDP